MANYKYRHRETYKDVHIDIKANSTKELLIKLHKKKDQIDRQSIDPNMPLSKFANLYIETYKKPKVSDDWYTEIEKITKKITDGIGNKRTGAIKPLEVQNFLNNCYYSESYIKKIYDLTKQLFKYAYKNGVISTDFADDLIRPEGRKNSTGRAISSYEQDMLLAVLNGQIKETWQSDKIGEPHRGELFCKIMLYCNLRPGEVSALQWKDIDFKKECIHVNKARKKNGAIGKPKSAAGTRDIPIPEHFILRLKELQGDPFDLVCTQKNGKPHTETTIKNMWNNIRRLMNIGMGCRMERNELIPPFPLANDFILYNLRHTCCTNYEKMGVPINIASRFMGHSDISITSKIYTHGTEDSFNLGKNLINGKKRVSGTHPGNDSSIY